METLIPLMAAFITLIALARGEAATRRPVPRVVHAMGTIEGIRRSGRS
jgi:hypothetical protein